MPKRFICFFRCHSRYLDFAVRKNSDYGLTNRDSTIKVIRVGKSIGQLECEQQCRLTPDCVGYVLKLRPKTKCHLKR